MQRLIVAGWFLWCIVGAQVKFPNAGDRTIVANDKEVDTTSNDDSSGVIWPVEDNNKEKLDDRIRVNVANPQGVNNKVESNDVDPHGVKWPGDDKDNNKSEQRPDDNASGVKWPGNDKHYGMTATQACNAGQDCVPYNQCENGQIKTDGANLLGYRGRTPASDCVSHKPAHTGATTICCGIPGWVAPATTVPPVVTCAHNQKCVKEELCDENGNIRTDGRGLLVDRNYNNPKKCFIKGKFDYRDTTSRGVCCTPPPTASTPSPWVVAPECGISSPTPEDFVKNRIASPGHNEAYFGQFPWQAAVFFSNFTFQCGATIIGDRWVLTAAHCIHKSSAHELKIRVGEWQVNSFEEPLNYEDVDVKAVKKHEHFNSRNGRNNLAILELTKPLVWQYHINRICLPCDGQEFWGKRCLGSGWGKESFAGNFADILKLVDLPIVENIQCQNQLRKTRLGEYFIVHDSFLCAGGEDNKDACKGDGGGPLACQNPDGRYVVAGITNTGVDCGKKDVPGLYTDVVHFLPWIRNTIGGSYQAGCHTTPKPPHHQQGYHPATQAPYHQPAHHQQGNNGGKQEDVHQQVDGKDYHFSWKKDGLRKFSHPQAIDYCKFLPGDWHIIAIESQTENDYVSNIIKTTPVEYIWTDGVRTKSTHIWSWPNGGPFSPLAWSTTGAYQQHQPDNHNASGEDCLAILNNAYSDGVRWHDVQCSLPKFTICERVSRPGW